jgi:hypothetical protein
MQRRRLTQPPYRMGPFQQALDHSLKTYFINGLYLRGFSIGITEHSAQTLSVLDQSGDTANFHA